MRSIFVKAAADAKATPVDPRNQIRIVSWNCGSLRTQRAQIAELLACEAPHLLCLQEAECDASTLSCFRLLGRETGYSILVHSGSSLVTFVRRGLNVVALKPSELDAGFRVQRIGIQLCGSRLLVRHIHAPSGNGKANERRQLFSNLDNEEVGRLFLDVGDFNQLVPDSVNTCALRVGVNTFKKNPRFGNWVSNIDGARVLNYLEAAASVAALQPRKQAQHRLVLLEIRGRPMTHLEFAWKPGVGISRAWSLNEIRRFNAAMACSIDEAWALWHKYSGGPAFPSRFVKRHEWGAWTVGDEQGSVDRIFRRIRVLHGKAEPAADAEADKLRIKLALIIEEASKDGLQAWRAKVSTRAGSAAWIRSKLANRKPPTFGRFGGSRLFG